MFSKVFFVAAALIAFVAASPVPQIGNSCNAGSTHCCNKTYQSGSVEAKNALDGLLGNFDLSQLTGQIGTECTPITGIGAGQAGSCTQQSACCNGNSFNGVVGVDCSPINVNA